jgi:hypothetical protein
MVAGSVIASGASRYFGAFLTLIFVAFSGIDLCRACSYCYVAKRQIYEKTGVK